MNDWLADLPLWWASALTVVLFVLIAIGCFFVPPHVFMADAPDQSRWRDVRWWALLLVALQLGIYALFS